MKKYLLFLVAALLTLLVSAQTKVEINGIWYNPLSDSKQTDVTNSHNGYSSDTITIPAMDCSSLTSTITSKSMSSTRNNVSANVTISATSFNFEAESKGKSKTLVVTSNVPVSIGIVSSDSDWLDVSPSSITHDDATVSTEKNITLSVKSDNTGDQEREAKFNILWTDENDKLQTKEITVVQMPKDLKFTVSTSSIPFSNVGGDRNFTVTSNLDLELVTIDDATSGSPDWFRLDMTDFHSPGVIGKTESFKVTVDKNMPLKKRSGKISIIRKSDGKEMGSVSVAQDGSFASVDVSAVSFNFAAQSKGQSKTLVVTSNVPVSIGSVSSDSDWLDVSPSSITHDDATVSTEKNITLSVKSDNTGDNERQAKFNITWKDQNDQTQKKEITVVQSGKGIDFTVNPSSLLFENVGGERSFTITSNVDLKLVAEGTPDWFRLNKTEFQSPGVIGKTESFKVTVDKNMSLKERSGEISIYRGDTKMGTVSITQNGSFANVTISAASFNFEAESKGKSKTLVVTSNVPVSIGIVSSDSDWLDVSPSSITHDDAAVSTEKNITLFVKTDNTGDQEREAKFNILWTDENDKLQKKEITVVQGIKTHQGGNGYLTVNTNNMRYNPSGGSFTVDVTSNIDWDVEVAGGGDWLTVTPLKGSKNGSLTIEATDNSNPSPREAMITVSGSGLTQTIEIYQEGNGYLTVNANNMRYNPSGGSMTVNVTSNIDWDVEVAGGGDWLTVTPLKGSKNGSLTITAADNSNPSPREATITVSGSKLTQTIKVYQEGTAKITIDKTFIGFNKKGGSDSLKITSNVDWFIDISYINGNDWLSLNPLSGGGYNGDKHETTITLNVEENSDSEDREANVRIHWNNGVNESITIVKIKQKFEENTLDIYSESGSKEIVFTASATEQKPAKIFSNRNWTISCDSSWVHIEPKRLEGNGNHDLTVNVDPRAVEDYYQRTAVLVVETTDKSLRDSIIIRQSGTAYLNSPKSVPFTVKDDIRYADISSNVPWRVFLSEEMSWLKIEEPAELKGEGNGAIKLHADFNENTGSGRSGVMCVKYLGPDGDSIVIDIPITQDRCPIVPEELLLVDTLYTPDGVVEATIRESVNLVVDTTGYDNSDKWIFEWVVNGATQTSYTNSLGYEMRDKQMYPVAVKIKYEDDPTNEVLQQSMEFELYPAPQIPTKLVKKGDGTSGIMIAEFVENNQFANDFNGEYEFIFGYSEDTQEGTTYNRYYQYSNKALVTDETVEKWVYTQWEIDNRLIQSKNKRSSTGKSIPNATRSTTAVNTMSSNHLEMTGNKLKVSLSNSTSAYVAVISMSGVVVRDFDLSSNEAINETLDFYELPPGAYIVKCNLGEQSIVKKIVIK